MPFGNPVVGGVGNLVRSWIQSVPFVSGLVGWRISRDGDAEFNNATFRGSIVITSGKDLLVYSTNPPALNKLILALAGSAGNDAFGNTWQAGLNVYDANGVNIGLWNPVGGFTITNDNTTAGQIVIQPINSGTRTPRIFLRTNFGTSSADGFIEAQNFGGNQDIVLIEGPISTADVLKSNVDFLLIAGFLNGEATGDLRWSKTSGSTPTTALSWDKTGVHIPAGDINAVQPGTSAPAQPEVWNSPALAAGWGSTGVIQPVRYRLLPMNNVEVVGVLHSTIAAPSSNLWTMPAAYVPFWDQRVNCLVNKGGGVISPDIITVSSATGVVTLGLPVTAVGWDVMLQFIYPLLAP